MNVNFHLRMVPHAVFQAGMKPGLTESLYRAAGYVYKTARNSIRRKPLNVYSKAGSPPFAHAKGFTDLKKSIAFQVDREELTAVIGPVHYKGGLGNVARLHEFGGEKKVTKRTYNPQDWNTAKAGPIRLKGNLAVFAPLHSQAQRARAWKIDATPGIRYPGNSERAQVRFVAAMKAREGAERKGSARYSPRPFMRPAMEKTKDKIASAFAGAVSY